MREGLLDYLACPKCGSDLEGRFAERRGPEIVTGTLDCTDCSGSFRISGGIPRMNDEMEALENVARTFGYEWKAHHAGTFEDDTLFGRTRDEDWAFFLECLGKREEDVRGTVTLDAGCGSGSFTRLIGEHGARAAIGVDINEAVDEAYRHCRDLENVHIVQANIFALPFKRHLFDLVWSSGVIHHTPDAAGAHRSLSRHVQPGGTLYVWVYARRFNPFRFVKTIFELTRLRRLPEPALVAVSKAISYPSLALLQGYRALRSAPPLKPRTARGERTVRRRTLKEIQLTWFDALSPEFDSRHTEEEVLGWFSGQGFREIVALEEPKVGVRGVATACANGAAPEA